MERLSTIVSRLLCCCLLLSVVTKWTSAAEPIIVTAVGASGDLRPIPAYLAPDSLDKTNDLLNIVVVSGMGVECPADQLQQIVKTRKNSLSVSAVGFPRNGLKLFPPTGPAYNRDENREAMYLWRWLGMQGPDLVVVLDAAARSANSSVRIPESVDKLHPELRRVLDGQTYPEQPDLASQLAIGKPCQVGSIPSLRLLTTTETVGSDLQDLLSELDNAKIKFRSAARQELVRRQSRSPRQIALELADVYGRDLKQVSYIPSIAAMARLRLAKLEGRTDWQNEAHALAQPFLDGTKKAKATSGSTLSGHLLFCELAEDVQGADREAYVQLVRRIASLGVDDSGQPKQSMPFHNGMSDAVFMGGPILAWTSELTDEEMFRAACVQHCQFIRKMLVREDGLYRHSALDEAAWGRGNGFPALGMAIILEHLSSDHPGHKLFLVAFRRHLKALSRHQDPTGAWHQVIDNPATYRELTSTCMITYAMIRGIDQGWLGSAEFRPVVERAWGAISRRIGNNGELVDVCTGTGKQKNLAAYFNRTAILGRDARGGAMALQVAVEWFRFTKQD